ncbi:hypothetical protein ACFL5A_02660 [Gemmatimonadota bacterium]
MAKRLLVRAALYSTVAALLFSSCTDGPTEPLTFQISIVTGENQNGVVGEPLDLPVVFEVKDNKGRPAEGFTVDFQVTGGGGSVSPSSAVSPPSGRVQATWTLGTATGEGQTLRASLRSKSVSAEVQATTVSDEPVSLLTAGGNNQNGVLGRILGDSLVVLAKDRFGNPVPGLDVTWSTVSGGGTLTPQVTETNAAGETWANWILGNVDGPQVVTASANGLQAVFFAFGSPFDISDQAVVVDSAQVTLVSDSTERQNGILRFASTSGSFPEIQVGDVVVGIQDGGFLRKVTGIQSSGNQLVLTTSEAALEEIIKEGSFETQVQLSQASPVGGWQQDVNWGPTEVSFLAPGATAVPGRVSLSGFDLCEDLIQAACPPGLSLDIPSGNIVFDPNVDLGVEFGYLKIKEFHAIASGTLRLDLDIQVQANSEFTASAERKLAQFRKPFVVSMVAGEVRLKLFLGFAGSGGATGTITTGFTASNVTEVGARFEEGGWASVFENDSDFSPQNTVWSAGAGADVRVYLRPELEVVFYTVAGPRIGLEPYLRAQGVLDSPSWQLQVLGGIDATLGFTIEILSHTIQDFSRTLSGPEWQVFNGTGELTGDLQVSVGTSGEDLDPDGYLVVLDNTTTKGIPTNGSTTFEDLPLGSHSVHLTDVADNCAVSGANPRTVDVRGGVETTSFSVVCQAVPTTGDLQVDVSTSGQDLDPDGYTVVVDGVSTKPVATNGSTTFDDLSIGSHTVQLTGAASNCSVAAPNPRTVSIPAGGASTTFLVSCDPIPTTGTLVVATSTTGEDLDPDGYQVVVDGSMTRPIAANGTTTFEDLLGGYHTVQLMGIASNCAVSGTNPRTVTVPVNGSVTLSFSVVCFGNIIRQGDFTFDGTQDLRADNGIMWLQVAGDAVQGNTKEYIQAGGISGGANFLPDLRTIRSAGNVDQLTDWVTKSFSVELVDNSPTQGVIRVTVVDTANGKEITKRFTITLESSKPYAVVDLRFTNTGASSFLYDERTGHIHDGAQLARVFSRELSDLDAFINGVGVIGITSQGLWASYTPDQTAPYLTLYRSVASVGLTFGFISPWDHPIHQMVSQNELGVAAGITLMAREFALSPGQSAQWRAVVAFHNGGQAEGTAIYNSAAGGG